MNRIRNAVKSIGSRVRSAFSKKKTQIAGLLPKRAGKTRGHGGRHDTTRGGS